MSQEIHRPSSFSFLPPVVKNLLIINALMYFAMITIHQVYRIDITDYLGLRYMGASEFRPYQLITYMFLHSSDFNHIFFNMFALWMFGVAIENYWGPKRFLVYYLVTGIGAALVQNAITYFELKHVLDTIQVVLNSPTADNIQNFIGTQQLSHDTQQITVEFIKKYNLLLSNGDSIHATQLATNYLSEYKTIYLNAPVMVGASGAVFGLLLAFGMLFPNQMIYIYFFIPLKAKYFVIFYGVLELFFGVSGIQGNVAHFAHLGGMLFGIILILYWKYKANKRIF